MRAPARHKPNLSVTLGKFGYGSDGRHIGMKPHNPAKSLFYKWESAFGDQPSDLPGRVWWTALATSGVTAPSVP